MYNDYPVESDGSMPTLQSIFEKAAERSVSAARIMIEDVPLMIRPIQVWREPYIDERDEDLSLDGLELHEPNHHNDLLTRFISNLCESAQFPTSTAYLHGLACVASAMIHNFTYNYYGSPKPVNLYAVTSQPPSSGKSMINSYLSDPVRHAYDLKRKENAEKRRPIEKAIKKAVAELDKATNEKQELALCEDLAKYDEELRQYPLIEYSTTNATPEGLEHFASKQNGVFNVVSDEANGINTLLGKAYGDGGNLSNADIILQGWDGDYMNVQRIGRDGYGGIVKGCVAVIAQDETINSILEAGLRGNGISERFLLLKEPTRLGTREFNNYKPVDLDLKAEYFQLVKNLVYSKKVELSLSKESFRKIIEYKQLMEPSLGDNGQYSHSMLRGAFGKMDKQIMKISSVLHAIENWRQGGDRTEEIQGKTIDQAYVIYNCLIATYIKAADSQGFVGEKSEMDHVRDLFKRWNSKKTNPLPSHYYKVEDVRVALKNHSIYKGKPQLSKHLREIVLPRAERMGFCVFHDKKIFLNPKL